MNVSTSRVIDLSAEKIWDAMSRFGDVDQWATGVLRSAWKEPDRLDQPVGSVRFCDLDKFGYIAETIEHWEPGRALTYSAEGMPFPMKHATNAWTFRPLGPDQTEVTTTITVRLRPGTGFMSTLVKKNLRKVQAVALDDLAHFATGGTPSDRKLSEKAA
jgi:Polyketide cyclase / dehydrase and lipid transport